MEEEREMGGYVFLPMLAGERVWGGLAFGKGGGASACRREKYSFCAKPFR